MKRKGFVSSLPNRDSGWLRANGKKGFVSSLPNRDSGWLRANGDIAIKNNEFFNVQSSRWVQAAGTENFFTIRNLNW